MILLIAKSIWLTEINMSQPVLSPTLMLERSDHVLTADMGDEVIMMDMDKGTYFSLNGTGGLVWKELERPMTLEQVVRVLSKACDLDEAAQVEADVTLFLTDLYQKGLARAAAPSTKTGR